MSLLNVRVSNRSNFYHLASRSALESIERFLINSVKLTAVERLTVSDNLVSHVICVETRDAVCRKGGCPRDVFAQPPIFFGRMTAHPEQPYR